MHSRRLIALYLWLSTGAIAAAEDVEVKYQGIVPLDTFKCEKISRRSFINRVCYDASQEYMIILLQNTYYHYCEIDQGTVDNLMAAKSMGSYFNANIRGKGGDGPFDCRTHRIPPY